MNRIKRMMCMALAVLIFASTMIGASASQVHYLPDVTAQMADASYWTQNTEVLMTPYEAARRNKTLPSCSFKRYPARHGLMGVRTQLSKDIADFIVKSLE